MNTSGVGDGEAIRASVGGGVPYETWTRLEAASKTGRWNVNWPVLLSIRISGI